jgi:hypothetical protein
MWSLISGLFSILGGWLGLQKGKQDRLNAPDMVQNKQAQDDQIERDRIESAVDKGDKGDMTDERKLGS